MFLTFSGGKMKVKRQRKKSKINNLSLVERVNYIIGDSYLWMSQVQIRVCDLIINIDKTAKQCLVLDGYDNVIDGFILDEKPCHCDFKYKDKTFKEHLRW